ncbi:unnamed protein product [Rhizophagus irregularis]|nr:unnamed protein product [Rhizophagus irregularis]
MVLCVTRFFHSRFFLLRKFNFNVNFVTLPSSHLEKILKTFYFPLWRSLGFFFVVKAKIYRQLCFFFTSVLSHLPPIVFFFHFGSFPLLKPNFKADPISKVTFHFDSYGRSSPDSDDTESVTSTTSEHEKCTWKL